MAIPDSVRPAAEDCAVGLRRNGVDEITDISNKKRGNLVPSNLVQKTQEQTRQK